MPKASLADHSLEWYHLVVSVDMNAEDVPYLAELKEELETVLNSVKVLDQERAALDAQRQQVTRDIQALKRRGRIAAARLRSGLRAQYGFGSEKLTEFGMRPRRRRTPGEGAEPAGVAKITSPDPVS